LSTFCAAIQHTHRRPCPIAIAIAITVAPVPLLLLLLPQCPIAPSPLPRCHCNCDQSPPSPINNYFRRFALQCNIQQHDTIDGSLLPPLPHCRWTCSCCACPSCSCPSAIAID
jgi:hypothetical protein